MVKIKSRNKKPHYHDYPMPHQIQRIQLKPQGPFLVPIRDGKNNQSQDLNTFSLSIPFHLMVPQMLCYIWL